MRCASCLTLVLATALCASAEGVISLKANWKPPHSVWPLSAQQSQSRTEKRRDSSTSVSSIRRSLFDWSGAARWVEELDLRTGIARADAFENAEWLVNVGIGTPRQSLQVIIDTGSPVSWVYSKCCYSTNHSYFRPTDSKTFANRSITSGGKVTATLKAVTEGLNISYLSGSTTLGYLGFDDIQFSNSHHSLTVRQVTLGLVTQILGLGRADDPLEGLLGLGPTTYAPIAGGFQNPFQAMASQHLLKEPYVTLELERRDQQAGGGGRYVFGDTTQPQVAWTESTSSIYWGGTYDSLRMISPLKSTRVTTDDLRRFVIDSGSSIVFMPAAFATQIHKTIHGSSYSTSILLGTSHWLVPCKIGQRFYEASLEPSQRTPTFVIDVGNSSFAVPPTSFAYQPQDPVPAAAGLGLEDMCLSAFQEGPQNFIILGGTFLTSISVTLDLGTSVRPPRIGFANRTQQVFPSPFLGGSFPGPGPWFPPQSQS